MWVLCMATDRAEEAQEEIVCPLCGRDDFDNKQSLNNHLYYSKKNGYCYTVDSSCPFCKRGFKDKNALYSHINKRRKNSGRCPKANVSMLVDKKNNACTRCGRVFPTYKQARAHASMSTVKGYCSKEGRKRGKSVTCNYKRITLDEIENDWT